MPKGRKDIFKDGFKKGQTGNPNGRPLKLVGHVNKELLEQGYTVVRKSEVLDAFQVLVNLPASKILEIAKLENDDYPVLYKLVAKELLGKRGAEYLEKLLDRAFGKANQSISGEITQTVITVEVPE